ncbi:VOC family protein [Erythrobacter arachoides]|uniref:VOC family protein n=1 Tax=Aurantiacibacter arachoides TaxID=1850444 RepID=A0A845A0Y4_9SPHN|nr:VOC family protein [Aurantiacibacter arachoides]MXO93598.1 VOC family protein [Aurantiacibacter arachoides]GGD48159.1 glyoxalase [Aurantiacibacter arachoides]
MTSENGTSDKGAFVWYELMTPDPAGAKAFYDAVIGWDVHGGGHTMPNGREYRMIARSDGKAAGGVLTLSAQMQAGGARPGWIGYICHPDVDAAVEAVIDAGGSVHMPPRDMPGVGRMAMVADPWGAAFYVMDPAPPADDPDAKSDVFDYEKPQHFRWNELQSGDPEAATGFYTGLFGWRQEGSMPMGDLGDYRFLYQGDGMIGAVMQAMPQGGGSGWTPYIGVDDIDRAARAIVDGGGRLFAEPQQIPGGEYSVNASDPQGAAFGLVGPRKE